MSGHPLVAIEVARWISAAFGVWCNMHIKALIETGKAELIQEVQQPVERLLPQRDAIDYIDAANKLRNLPDGILKRLFLIT